jgi:hypothetical protein
MCATPITVNVPVEQLCVDMFIDIGLIIPLRQLGLKTIRVNPSKIRSPSIASATGQRTRCRSSPADA